MLCLSLGVLVKGIKSMAGRTGFLDFEHQSNDPKRGENDVDCDAYVVAVQSSSPKLNNECNANKNDCNSAL
jgi:hypothetical protein